MSRSAGRQSRRRSWIRAAGITCSRARKRRGTRSPTISRSIRSYPPEYGGGFRHRARPPSPARRSDLAAAAFAAKSPTRSAPVRMINCHCSRCRRGRSAAHATNVIAKIDAFRWLRGSDILAEYKVPEARFFAVAFCTAAAATCHAFPGSAGSPSFRRGHSTPNRGSIRKRTSMQARKRRGSRSRTTCRSSLKRRRLERRLLR